MRQVGDQQPRQFYWWLLALFSAFTAANIVLIIVAAPVWARLIPAWIVLAIVFTALIVFLLRRSANR